MKCPYCGAEIGNSKNCEYCGSQISAEMRKEQEAVNKQGCPRCNSTNISFSREKQGEIQGKRGSNVIRKTVGLCKDCGYTWEAADYKPAKRKTWLWVLGWIFIFPLPLTILMLRKKTMKPAIKYGIIAAAWLIYLVIGLGNNSSKNNSSTTASVSEATAEATVDNPLLACDIMEADVKSGSGKVIGKRAYINIPEDEFKQLSDDQIAEFVNNNVDGADYNYYTIDFGNGRGVVFPGCMGIAGTIGEIDSSGSIMASEYNFSVSSDGKVSKEKVVKEDSISKPKEESEKSTDSSNIVESAESVAESIESATESVESAESVESEESTESSETVSQTQLMDVYISLVTPILKENFKDKYELSYDETGITVNVWNDNIGTAAALAKTTGNKELMDSWNTMKNNIQYMSESFTESAETIGLNDTMIMVNVLNDLNKENVLLSYINGVCVYDALKDS